MIYADERGGETHWVADSMKDLATDGWTVLIDEPFKPGVHRVHVKRGGAGTLKPECRIIFVSVPE